MNKKNINPLYITELLDNSSAFLRNPKGEFSSHLGTAKKLFGTSKLSNNFRKKVFRDTNRNFMGNMARDMILGAAMRATRIYMTAENKDTALDKLRVEMDRTDNPQEKQQLQQMYNKISKMSNLRYKLSQGMGDLAKGTVIDAARSYATTFYNTAKARNDRLNSYGTFDNKDVHWGGGTFGDIFRQKNDKTGRLRNVKVGPKDTTGISWKSSDLRRAHSQAFGDYGKLMRSPTQKKKMTLGQFDDMRRNLDGLRVSQYSQHRPQVDDRSFGQKALDFFM